MPKTPPPLDVLVLGEHPAAYLAAALLVAKPGVNVVHATIPTERSPDRLTLVNPEVFHLHKPLEKLKKKLSLTPIFGVSFLGEDPNTRGEFHAKTATASIGSYDEIRRCFRDAAKEAGVKLHTPKSLGVGHIDEK